MVMATVKKGKPELRKKGRCCVVPSSEIIHPYTGY